MHKSENYVVSESMEKKDKNRLTFYCGFLLGVEIISIFRSFREH
jgi:hypothetical protein